MITSSDVEYRNTKLIKQRKACLDKPFDELAELIRNATGIKPINFHYDILEHNNRPRLQVIFERCVDSKKFHSHKKLLFFRLNKEKLVADLFCKVFKNDNKFRTDNLYIIFETFENIAKEEANSKVPENKIDSLRKKYADKNLWEIRKTFTSAIFLFQTNEQIKNITEYHISKELKNDYFQLIKQFDEFNYLKNSEFEVSFDSRENFVNNYQSNWFYYHKDH